MAKSIKKIPATKNQFTAMPNMAIAKRRVAAYARVSTDSDEQYTSYEAQIDYYTQYIKKREGWEFVKVYTDEGISGTDTKHRDGFNEMINDALNGKIDLIVTKSVSRFARNTVDSLTTIRKLKDKGCECYFEKENIWTFDSKGELLITIMSSLAQEESHSISENVTWGHRKRMADGKFSLAYSTFLGYKKGPNGTPIIDEEEAQIVRLIYRLYLDGKSTVAICKEFNEKGISTPSGKGKWSISTVNSILTNEKYKGDALLQKQFTVDFLTKKTKVNEGELPQYYVEGSHPAIIDRDEWDMVQDEVKHRSELSRALRSTNILSARLICEDCGGFYGPKVWHSIDKYRKEIWQCNSKYKKERFCQTPNMDAETIKSLFIKAYSELMADSENITTDLKLMQQQLCNCKELDAKIKKQTEEIAVIEELVRKSVADSSSANQSEDEQFDRYNSLIQRYDNAVVELNSMKQERSSRKCKSRRIGIFIKNMQEQPGVLTEWSDTIWTVMIEKAIVHRDKSITFIFKSGTEIRVGD